MTMEPYQIREDFIRCGIRREAKKNQYLFDPSREGCDNICFLDEGIAALTRINDDGEEHVYLYFGEKRLVGFANALVKHFPYDWQRYITPSPFWITAKTNCVYYSMREKQFESMMDSSPYFTQCVLGATTLNYLELVNKIQWMMDGDKTAQFCKWLLTYSIKKHGKSMIPKAFSFVEVANYLGMHPVTVSRIARKLRETGIIAREDGFLVIQEEEKLIAMTLLQNG